MPSLSVEQLRWVRFPVLDDGFVCLVDAMGDDSSVVQAARVSYGQDVREFGDAYEEARKTTSSADEARETARQKVRESNRNLIRYMMSGGYQMKCPHGTPFEMAEIKLLVRCPMDTWRQWIRHRTANVNEYSTRYSEAIDSQQKTPPDQWRLQSTTNKQGSTGFLPEDGPPAGSDEADEPCGRVLTNYERDFHATARAVYKERIDAGVAREQARKDLPLSTYTEAYWKCDLRNVLHFLGLRMDSHAQWEIRQYANTIGEQIIKPLFPLCWEAFEDFQLGSLPLSRKEVEFIATMMRTVDRKDRLILIEDASKIVFANNREREACLAKLKELGII